MAALVKDRNTPYRTGSAYRDPLAAGERVFAGSIAVLNAAGNAASGSVAVGLIARGMFQEQVDNSAGADGAKSADIQPGVFRFANAGDITRANIGDDAYIDDDQTVTAVTTGRSVAGVIKDVESDGVWIQIG